MCKAPSQGPDARGAGAISRAGDPGAARLRPVHVCLAGRQCGAGTPEITLLRTCQMRTLDAPAASVLLRDASSCAERAMLVLRELPACQASCCRFLVLAAPTETCVVTVVTCALRAWQATLRELSCADSLEELQHLLAPAVRISTPISAPLGLGLGFWCFKP